MSESDSDIIQIFKMTRRNLIIIMVPMLRTVIGKVVSMQKHIQITIRESEVLRKAAEEVLEIKTTARESMDAFDGPVSRLDMTEQRVDERTYEISKTDAKRRKNKEGARDCLPNGR